jgi:hypothetical protein
VAVKLPETEIVREDPMPFLRSRLSTSKRGGLVLVAGEAWGVRATAA